jgi:hypothetical protein
MTNDEDRFHRGIVKGLAALFQNPKQDTQALFPDVPVHSSLKGLKSPFFASDVGGSFTALPEAFVDGCYLIYDNASGGTLVLHYSHKAVPENAVGFWSPGFNMQIQSWKYDKAGGYSELLRGIVGGTRNNRRYYQGWCQFIQMAKSMQGEVKKIPSQVGQSLPVDLYGFAKGRVKPLQMDNQLVDVSDLEAVVCVPQHNDRFKGIHDLVEVAFLDHGNREGAALKLHD